MKGSWQKIDAAVTAVQRMGLTPSELSEVARHLHKLGTKEARRALRVGDLVWFDARNRGTIRGKVTRFMPKNVEVFETDDSAVPGRRWTVAPSLLHPATAEEATS